MKRLNSWLQSELLFVLLLISFCLSLFFQVSALGNNTAVFTMDQGRDLLDIRHMVYTLTPRLVGPTTSLNGVMLGPFWYYFNLLPFVLTSGNPNAISMWQVFWYQISGIILFVSLRRLDRNLASITTTFFMLMPIGFNTLRFFWNANSMPIFTTFFFAFLVSILYFPLRDAHKFNLSIIALGFLTGISFQVEAAFGVLFFPFASCVVWKMSREVRKVLYLLFGFFLTLVPQILFEFRHGFLMSRIFLSEVLGSSSVLGSKIPLAERVGDRLSVFLASMRDANHIPQYILVPIFSLLLINFLFRCLQKKTSDSFQKLFFLYFTFLSFSFVFYILFPQTLKVWYTYSLSVIFVLILGLLTSSLLKVRIGSFPAGLLLTIILILSTLFYTGVAQNEYLQHYVNRDQNNQSVLRHEITVIDWIYNRAQGQSFIVYSFTPSIYDYAFQYLFWWYGFKKYHYRPTEIAYLPSQPEYIKDMKFFWKDTKPTNSETPTFLIIEKSDNKDLYNKWMGNFSGLCETASVAYPFNVSIKQMYTCKK